MFISKNKNFKEEYCATVVQIGETFPIEGRDRIVKTLVNGLSIVIGKDEFKTGDIAVYCANETCLHELFLHLNSMYEDKELNIDQETQTKEYYQILGVKPGALIGEIKKAFRKKVIKFHPDRSGNETSAKDFIRFLMNWL